MTSTTNGSQVPLFARNADKYDRYCVSVYFEKQGLKVEHEDVVKQILDNQRIVKEITAFIREQKLTDRVSVDVIDSIIFPRTIGDKGQHD